MPQVRGCRTGGCLRPGGAIPSGAGAERRRGRAVPGESGAGRCDFMRSVQMRSTANGADLRQPHAEPLTAACACHQGLPHSPEAFAPSSGTSGPVRRRLAIRGDRSASAWRVRSRPVLQLHRPACGFPLCLRPSGFPSGLARDCDLYSSLRSATAEAGLSYRFFMTARPADEDIPDRTFASPARPFGIAPSRCARLVFQWIDGLPSSQSG